MVAKIQNLRIMRGDTTRIGITVKGLDGVPEALSFSCKRSPALTSYTFQKTLDDGIDIEQTEEGQRYVVTISPDDTQRRYANNSCRTDKGDLSMTYYAQRKSIKNGEPTTPNNRYGTRPEMERQYHLYCASACTNADDNEVDSIEWGTLEHGIIERKCYIKETEPETEGEE